MVADVSSDLRRERPFRCEINKNWKSVGHDSWKNERRARLWSIATHSWLKAASPRARKSRSKFSKAASNPSTALSSASTTRLAGVAVLGSAVISDGAVAVGAALLFESGFRRRGAGLRASACSVVGSDSRRLLRPARGLRAARFGVLPDAPHALRDFLWQHRSWVARPSCPPWLSPCRSRDKYQKHYENPPVDTIATVMAMRTARPMANLMASRLDW